MKRTLFDERRDQQIAAEFNSAQMSCSFCGRMSDKADLSTYGARCLSCLQSYCEQGEIYPALTPEQRREIGKCLRAALSSGLRASPRQHLANLRQRAASGSPMTSGQRGFLAAARGAFVEDQPAELASMPMLRPVVRAHLPVLAPCAAEMPEPPAWVTEYAGEAV